MKINLLHPFIWTNKHLYLFELKFEFTVTKRYEKINTLYLFYEVK